MTNSFRLSCESTADIPYSYVTGRDISVIFYSYLADGIEYEDNMDRDDAALRKFYGFLESGIFPSTSQINKQRYLEYFEPLLSEGDVLHIAFGSGLTPSVNNAIAAADELRGKYPDRRIVVIDSTCGSSGYGMMVDIAADMRDSGCTIDEIEEWILGERRNIQHQFFTTDLKYFRRSGRVSGAAATVANVLGICPVMHLDYDGRIVAYGKVRGKRNTMLETVDTMERHARGGRDYSGKCFISHSDCAADAEALRDLISERFPNIDGDIRIENIGTIIASHCGPGTVAVYYLGDERER